MPATALVVDASSAIGWLMPDERSPDLLTSIRRYDLTIAPWLLWVELRNVLAMQERRGRLPRGELENMLAAFDGISLAYDTHPDSAAVIALSRDHRLTIYDALYLELALRKGAALMTLDARLGDAARARNVELA